MTLFGRLFLTLLASLLGSAPASANIGDDLQQLRNHYGSVEYIGSQFLFEVRLNNGKIMPARGSADVQNHYSVTVYCDGGNSAMEVFTPNTTDPNVDIAQKDIDTIMAAAGDGLTWNSVGTREGKPTWIRADQKLLARLDPSTSGKTDGGTVFIIMLNTK